MPYNDESVVRKVANSLLDGGVPVGRSISGTHCSGWYVTFSILWSRSRAEAPGSARSPTVIGMFSAPLMMAYPIEAERGGKERMRLKGYHGTATGQEST